MGNPITEFGYKKIFKALEHLRGVERPSVVKDIAKYREYGDLKENADYICARNKQSFIEGKIKDLESKLSDCEIIDVGAVQYDVIKFGATVVMEDEDSGEEVKYQIVGEYESDISKGLLSCKTPLARSMIGKKEGDSFEMKTPKSTKYYYVVSICYNKVACDDKSGV